mmetsp:Transcript_73571/g.148840  ORF Transcript_73571/g.148840 Transcript_73571/m.148840 type:complete len:314 (-) Transcript_73571:29-970(-)
MRLCRQLGQRLPVGFCPLTSRVHTWIQPLGAHGAVGVSAADPVWVGSIAEQNPCALLTDGWERRAAAVATAMAQRIKLERLAGCLRDGAFKVHQGHQLARSIHRLAFERLPGLEHAKRASAHVVLGNHRDAHRAQRHGHEVLVHSRWYVQEVFQVQSGVEEGGLLGREQGSHAAVGQGPCPLHVAPDNVLHARLLAQGHEIFDLLLLLRRCGVVVGQLGHNEDAVCAVEGPLVAGRLRHVKLHHLCSNTLQCLCAWLVDVWGECASFECAILQDGAHQAAGLGACGIDHSDDLLWGDHVCRPPSEVGCSGKCR